MKTIVVIILFVFSTPFILADNEQPADPDNPTCEECLTLPQQYPHFVCTDNSSILTSECIKFPLSVEDSIRYKNKCFKSFPHKFCIKYVPHSNPFTQFTGDLAFDPINGLDQNDNLISIFSSYSLEQNNFIDNPILRAWFQWLKICNRTEISPEAPCCSILVKFANRPDEMGEKFEGSIAVSKRTHEGNDITPDLSCSIYCGSDTTKTARIMLNALPGFLEPEEFSGTFLGEEVSRRLPKNFFLTGNPLDATDKVVGWLDYKEEGLQYWDLYSVILHELGHMLGFNHFTKECPQINSPTESPMKENIDDNKRYQLSWQDKCAYKRNYCCNEFSSSPSFTPVLTSVVHDVNTDGKIPQLFPNPTNRTLTIPYNFESSVEFVVFGVDGTVVQT